MMLGHLKPGVTPAQAAADLDSSAPTWKEPTPETMAKFILRLAHPGLHGDLLERPARAFIAALMLLAVLILLAACANLGSLFAARAADRAREFALRLALGSTRRRILRGLLTEAMLISFVGGALGLWGSVISAALRSAPGSRCRVIPSTSGESGRQGLRSSLCC